MSVTLADPTKEKGKEVENQMKGKSKLSVIMPFV